MARERTMSRGSRSLDRPAPPRVPRRVEASAVVATHGVNAPEKEVAFREDADLGESLLQRTDRPRGAAETGELEPSSVFLRVDTRCAHGVLDGLASRRDSPEHLTDGA